MFGRKNVWYFLWIFPVVVIVCLDQQLPPHTVNVALNTPATQHGDLNDTKWCLNVTVDVCGVKKANLSVDGNTDTHYWNGSCSHAAVQDNPWWQVDLGEVYNISWIKIYNRAQPEDRVKSMKVTVGNTTCYTHNQARHVTTVMDIRCVNVTQGRLLSVSLTSGQELSLCEVQVLVCEDHWFGHNCSNQCHCINNATCDKTTGYCDKGCGDGWTGNDCQTECNNFTFGVNCAQNCHCDQNSTCAKTTGYCKSGCAAGWIGTGCQAACLNNTFGLNCINQCHCMNNTTCDKTTGYCQNGCAAGWIGNFCQKECNNYTFGVDCSQNCHCDQNTTCAKTTGYCKNGCAAGWIGTGCQTACQNNTFGLNCTHQCHCMNNTKCDKTTGYCQNGCAAGWIGNICQKECNNYTFGVDCSKNCHCDQNTTCAKTTGYCKNGCAAGWIGNSCQTACQNNTFGLNCTHQCHCMNNTKCDKTTGYCQNGCAAGWIGNVCQKECNNYTFGVDCSQNCHCDHNTTCAKTTGYCKNGCAAGWIGNSCQTACQNNTFGLNCTHQCHCMNNTKCDKTTGYCQNGCAAGWTRNVCQTECNTYTFGVNCSQKCHCDKNTICDKATGYCQSGCAAGWTGGDCQTGCSNYKYGVNCSQTCHCKDNTICNTTTGYCQGGCAAGWVGDGCQTECSTNTFGLNCSQKCHCQNNTTCVKKTGYCQSGCAAGWMDGDCQTECSTNTFGLNCSQKCHCENNTTCDKKTGYCQSGCAAGWMDGDCQTECSKSTYGINCTNQCHCKSSGVCEKTTGHCESGCADGWTGEGCQKPETGLNPAVIGGGVGGAVAILVVIAGIIIYKKRDRCSETNTSETKDEGGLHMSEMRKQQQPAAAPHVDDPGAVYANIRSRAVPVSELQQYIHERYGIDKGFENEYNMFPPGNQHPCDIGNSSGNKGKNRFIGIYPYDHSRVLLKKLPGKDHSDYINANYVHGYNTENAYIATQGPNPVTLPDFWRMIWEHDIRQIVMLTNVYETAKKKCEEYWPEAGKRKQFEDILVVNNGETARADWVIRNMQLKHKKTGEMKTVSQYHFVTWPDHGVPSAPAIVTFWKKVCHDGRSEESPLVVHCSAGIGRTGTFIGLDFLFDQAKAEGRVDFYHCIQKMRENRVNMIQTAEQYRFLHEAVFEATQSDSTFYTVDTFERAFQTSHFADEEENELIFKEMNSLNALRRTPGEKEIKAASFSANRTKNRSRAVIPTDRHRVMLSSPAPGTNDYINAVSLPFFAHKGEFLVTQMPLKKTVVDFWRMVVERGCNLIVALDAPDSVSSDEDVGVFLPKSNEPITCNPFIVLHNGVNTPCEGVTETFLTVKRESLYPNEDITSVSLLTFNDWPKDQEVPPHSETVIRFLNNLDQRMMKLASKPVVVHCFDGATRSGLICCLMNIMSRLKLDKEIDIHLSVRELKQRRRQFIPSSVQLRFCFATVKDYLNANRVSRHV